MRRERLADVACGGERIRVAVRALRVHVDEAHLDGAVAAPRAGGRRCSARRRATRSSLPQLICSGSQTSSRPPAKPNVSKPHRLQGAVAGEDHQVGPRELAAVLLLDRPEQPARLVEVGVVGPAVERREALLARPGAAAAVMDAVGARAVPRHPDEERAVVAVVGRPPVLRGRHDGRDVALDGLEVEGLELRGVVELRAHRVARRGVRVEDAAGRAGSATSRGSTGRFRPSPGMRLCSPRSSLLRLLRGCRTRDSFGMRQMVRVRWRSSRPGTGPSR